MIHELASDAFPCARPLFDDLRLCVFSVLDGTYPGRVWVDDPAKPAAALVASKQGNDLSGRVDDDLAAEIHRLVEDGTLLENVEGPPRESGQFVGHTDSAVARMGMILGDREPITVSRRCYRLDLERPIEPIPLPGGYGVRSIDLSLLEDPELQVDALLTRPIDSGYGSRAGFLERELGAAAIFEGRTVGHVFTNWVHGGACEVGAFVPAAHRGHGLAVALVHDVARQAREKGLARLEWQCEETNAPSIRVAEKAGCVRFRDHTFHAFYTVPAMQCVMAGHYRDLAGETEAALELFERAISMDGCPFYGPARAAGTHARLGHDDEALRLLHLAIDQGYESRKPLLENLHYEALRKLEGFREAIERIPEKPPES